MILKNFILSQQQSFKIAEMKYLKLYPVCLKLLKSQSHLELGFRQLIKVAHYFSKIKKTIHLGLKKIIWLGQTQLTNS